MQSRAGKGYFLSSLKTISIVIERAVLNLGICSPSLGKCNSVAINVVPYENNINAIVLCHDSIKISKYIARLNVPLEMYASQCPARYGRTVVG